MVGKLFLEEGIELEFILSGVFFLIADNEGGVAEYPVAERFIKTEGGLGVDDFDQNLFPVSLG